jgi:hypothetical protein
MKSKKETHRRDAIMVYFKLISQNRSGTIKQKYEKDLARIVGALTKGKNEVGN